MFAGLWLSPLQRRAVAEAVAVEEAELRLRLLTSPRNAHVLQSEVERRTAVFTQAYRESPRPAPMSPRRAAVTSVYGDVVHGLLP